MQLACYFFLVPSKILFLAMARKFRLKYIVILGVIILLGLYACYLLPQRSTRGISDREVVAGIILKALNAYHKDHNAYPDKLIGSVKEPYDTLSPNGGLLVDPDSKYYYVLPTISQIYGDDPLIKEGYLEAYPLVAPQPEDWKKGDPPPYRTAVYMTDCRWSCCFMPKITENSAGAKLDLVNNYTGEKVNIIGKRCFALGGVERDNHGEIYQEYSLWPGGAGVGGQYDAMTGFGYIRGDDFGLSDREAWLWFYLKAGQSIIPSQARMFKLFVNRDEAPPWTPGQKTCGLDLLNAKTGEFEPDGIPDGIGILYKLKDGKVVEVVRP